MKRQDILNSSAMPLAAPSFGRPPFRLRDRAALTVAYETEPEAVRELLPEPLAPDGATVSISFAAAAESPFGAYNACAVSLAARFGEQAVSYCLALFIDQEGPVFASREIWGLPAAFAEPELIVGETRATGTLDLGYGDQLRISIPVPEDDPAAAEAAEPMRAACKLIPGADGAPALAQLITIAPQDIAVRECWRGEPELSGGTDGPLDGLPVLRLLHGTYVLGDVTLPHGTVVHDYLADPG